jgi:hypothetical protein
LVSLVELLPTLSDMALSICTRRDVKDDMFCLSHEQIVGGVTPAETLVDCRRAFLD